MSYFLAVAAGIFIGIFVACAAALGGSRPDRVTLVAAPITAAACAALAFWLSR